MAVPMRTHVHLHPYMFRRGFARALSEHTLNTAFPGHGRNTTTRQFDAYANDATSRMTASVVSTNANLVAGIGKVGV